MSVQMNTETPYTQTTNPDGTIVFHAPAPPPVSVAISPTSVSVNHGGSQQFTATVQNGPNGVTWSSTGGSVNSSGLYTAPQTAETDTVTATSVDDPTKSASATVTVTVPPPVSVTISPTNPSVPVGTQQQFTATVQNGSQGITWSSTGGTITNTGLYTAPATAETDTVTATSVDDPTKSASATVTVTASGPQPLSFTNINYPYTSDPAQCFFSDTPNSIVVGSVGGNLYRYSEASGSWSQLPCSLALGGIVRKISFLPLSGKWLITTSVDASHPGSVFQYDAATGQCVKDAFTSNLGVMTHEYIAGVYTIVFRSYQGDAYSTQDGLTFTLLASPAAETVLASLLTSTGDLYMGGEDATQTPLYSHDHGVTWIPTNDGTLTHNLLAMAEAANGDIILSKAIGTGHDNLERMTPITHVISSSCVGLPIYRSVRNLLTLNNQRVLCTVDVNPPYLSTDDGRTWAKLNSGIPTTVTVGVFGKTQSKVYYHNSGVVYQSAY